MAPFTISPHHPLPYQCGRPQEALLMQSKMSPELLSSKPGTNDLPLNHNRTTSITKIRLHLWQVIRKVVNCCMSVTELFCSKMFLFICVGKNMAMTGELKKSGAEALEWENRDGKDPEMKVVMKFEEEEEEEEELIEPAVEQESSMIDSDEEEDDEARLSECESDEETDEEEEEDEDNEEEDCEPQDVDSGSEWSDDDDDDSEASAESLELWESFLHSSDPYNPLSFCSSTGSTKNTKQNQLTPSPQIKTQPTPARPEECHPKPNSKEGGKKVCFSDEVTVHPLVAWSFASRAARDGSCWLQMARDRDRFRRRVENIENVLKPCLTPEHRASVWERLQRTTLS